MGVYSEKIKKGHDSAHLTGEQIRAKKNQRSKLRSAERRATAQREELERTLVRTKRGDTGQLKELDNRLGVGVGAAKERKRLAERIAERAEAAKQAADKAAREKAAREEQKAKKGGKKGPKF